MKFIAHRGLHNKTIKENSLEAFIAGLDSNKYIGIETDVRVTHDNEYVLYHNALFKGNLVKNVNYEEFKKEDIPRLEELLEIKTDKIILLEIKDFDMNIDPFLKVLDKYNRNIYIMSFSNKVIDKFYEKKTKYKVGVLNYIINTPEVYKYNFICLLNDILDDYIIDSFRKKNIEVISYGIRNKESMKYDNMIYIVDDKQL